jgi:hypothetical protein
MPHRQGTILFDKAANNSILMDKHLKLPSELELIKDDLKMHITIWSARAADIVINITMLCS